MLIASKCNDYRTSVNSDGMDGTDCVWSICERNGKDRTEGIQADSPEKFCKGNATPREDYPAGIEWV